MSFGMIARADNGGLGALTWELWRHMQPARTLIVHGKHRKKGRAHPERYAAGAGVVRTTPVHPTPTDIEWLLDGIDLVYSAETWYSADLPRLAARQKVQTVLHVMPELYERFPADLLLAPTGWLPPNGARVLPFPVALDRFPVRSFDRVESLYHIASPVVDEDRNGTQLLLAAVAQMSMPCRLVIRGHVDRRVEQRGKCRVEWLEHYDGPYWEAWPDDVQAFVSPRRFAGLSLPMQEAAALGLPVVVLDRDPERQWFPTDPVPAHVTQRIRVAGPRRAPVDWYDTDPATLAHRLDTLVRDAGRAGIMAAAARAWAETRSWEALRPQYDDALTYHRGLVGRGQPRRARSPRGITSRL